MFDHGYPCPELIVDVVNRDGLAISIEAFASAGSMSSRDAQQPALHARWLERFVRLAPDASAIPTLQPSPPWLDWDLPRAVLWPTADDRPEDLNTILHASWIDDLAAAARRILVSTSLPWKVGHGDWESFNLSWDRDELVAAYDVDSVVALPEAAIAGAASAVFPACGEPVTADAAGCDAFLDAYAQARQQAWNDEERRVAWAAGTWLMAYNAKKESIDGLGPLQSQLRRDGRDRMARMATAM